MTRAESLCAIRVSGSRRGTTDAWIVRAHEIGVGLAAQRRVVALCVAPAAQCAQARVRGARGLVAREHPGTDTLRTRTSALGKRPATTVGAAHAAIACSKIEAETVAARIGAAWIAVRAHSLAASDGYLRAQIRDAVADGARRALVVIVAERQTNPCGIGARRTLQRPAGDIRAVATRRVIAEHARGRAVLRGRVIWNESHAGRPRERRAIGVLVAGFGAKTAGRYQTTERVPRGAQANETVRARRCITARKPERSKVRLSTAIGRIRAAAGRVARVAVAARGTRAVTAGRSLDVMCR